MIDARMAVTASTQIIGDTNASCIDDGQPSFHVMFERRKTDLQTKCLVHI